MAKKARRHAADSGEPFLKHTPAAQTSGGNQRQTRKIGHFYRPIS